MHLRLVVLGLASILYAPATFSQAGNTPPIDGVPYPGNGLENVALTRRPACTFVSLVVDAFPADSASNDSEARSRSAGRRVEVAVQKTRPLPLDDFNRSIYYRNKIEFSWEQGTIRL